MSTTALTINLAVSFMAFINYQKAGFFSLRLTLPFIIGSIPAAYIGGSLKIGNAAFSMLLSAVLIFASFRLLYNDKSATVHVNSGSPNQLICIFIGIGIGFISGLLGIGGGIFLSPLLIIMKWSDTKQAAATSACFIFLNSTSALIARSTTQSIQADGVYMLIAPTIIGGFLGSYLGSKKFSSRILRVILAIVLLSASIKLIINSLPS